ncbi:virulence surface antigen [Pseudomonas arsenicoxydans]|uniref:Virulence surface antigen n=1 Tax=Pseudomonas arsenicoxydans TaxID=702115 RepID=A0A1H0BJ16_9PSED|nr:TcdA/TcdB pore-forming domain-containing protein [Pseudomonas arsenicoxydans]SDN45601.1 virulence surface antigen [Pseudomonas arsenicoxydans]
MNNDNRMADGFKGFAALFELAELETALEDFKGTAEYEAIVRYYLACTRDLAPERQREPVALLKEALASLQTPQGRRRRASELEQPPLPKGTQAPDLMEIHDRVEAFQDRLNSHVTLLQSMPVEVPKILHFVWLGGGLGAIQRDYINVWKQVLGHRGFTLKLWYDSDAMLAHETNRIIIQAAKAHAMSQGGDGLDNPEELGRLYEERAIVLKTQMFEHINEVVKKGGGADDARIDLLVHAYAQDEVALKALRDKNLQSITIDGLQLRDVKTEQSSFQLNDIYQREIGLRGNLAAASDVLRAEVLFAEGGIYSDVDNLPPLANSVGAVDISRFDPNARLGVLQLLLNHNPQWMPGRQANKYASFLESIPLQHRETLERFARNTPALTDVFLAPQDQRVRLEGLRAVIDSNSLSNAWMMAHAESQMLGAVLERFRINYDFLDAVTQRAVQDGVPLSDDRAMGKIARDVALQTFGPLDRLPELEEVAIEFLMKGVVGYFGDGLLPDGDSTIYLTGPAAVRLAMADALQMPYTAGLVEQWNAEALLADSVNRFTEEEQDHSWKEAEGNAHKWLAEEKKRWKAGAFKARYAGDLVQLLDYQSIDFEEGWPVIEGRHVLITDVLQRLADHLGKPFLEAMRQRHTGSVTFDRWVSLSFDDRQLIIAQQASVRPPASLPDPDTRDLAVGELLNRIARESLPIGQVNPLQRLMLGALSGARMLDNRSFDAVSAKLENLANTVAELGPSLAYSAIEHAMFNVHSPAFEAGLSSVTEHSPSFVETATQLRQQALAQDLTLYQWGQSVSRIQQVAKLEYRTRIVERAEEVLGSFDEGYFKLVPQDLLLEGTGDRVAGRCLPLALSMAGAITKGGQAGNTLRERFYLGVIAPNDSDSKSFLSMLEELRGIQLSEIGMALPRADLAGVVARLEAQPTTCTLMLNTDSHAMLVARTINGEQSTWHFFDPNFGVFEFDGADSFSKALTAFFIQHEMARNYSASFVGGHPQFDLIALDGQALNRKQFHSGLPLSSLFEPGPLPELMTPPLRQRLASGRGQSLVNNAALGRSLLELDAQGWGAQIAQATRQLQTQHQLSADTVPLFETLHVTPTGEYTLSLVNPKAEQAITVVSTGDHRFIGIKQYLSRVFETLGGRQPVNEVDPTEAGSVHTLNAGFTVQALMNALRHHEGAASEENNALTTAIRLHAYVNHAQLVHGNVVDVLGVIQLVRQALNDEKIIARTSAPLVRGALGHIGNEGVGTVLGLVNVGFDIYQLNHAANDIQKAQFGTQLAFDSASAALAAAGIGAGLVGAGTAAAVLGGVSVILGGLAVGVAALAEGFAAIAEEAKQVGLFFDRLEKAYRQGGYHLDGASNTWIAHPLPGFAELDLRASTVRFDSPRLFPLRDHLGVPDFDVDYERAINIRQGLGLPGTAAFKPLAGQTIVLPCTPKTWYGYDYTLLPFVTTRHDAGFDTARRLEQKDSDGRLQFLFSFYSFPGEYVISRLNPVYKPTVFNVRLDRLDRTLVVPVLPKVWHDLITYRIEGAGAQCSVLLNPGVSLELDAPGNGVMRWVIEARWLDEEALQITHADRFSVGMVDVKLTGTARREVLFNLAGNKVMRLDQNTLQLVLIEEEADVTLDEQALLDHFKMLAQAHRLAMPYTPVHGFVVPFEKPDEPRTVVAFYDAVQDRFLYIRNNDVLLADEVMLGTVVQGCAYFYHPQGYEIWQVDATTGTLIQRYRLWVTNADTQITGVTLLASGAIQIVQKVSRQDGTHDELVFLIHEQRALLCSITRNLDPALARLLAGDTLADWTPILGDFVPPKASHTVDWQFAALVSVCWLIEADVRDLVWVRDRDRRIIRAPARGHRARGWPDSIKTLDDLVLIAPAGADADVMVIFDKTHRTLVRQQWSVAGDRGQWVNMHIAPTGLKEVIALDSGYVALTDTGLFFNLNEQGHLQFGGLADVWFRDRPQWWSALPGIAVQYPVSRFALLGLSSTPGNAKLCAWYVGDRLLLSSLGHGKPVRLLNVTPDGQAVWLFDLSTGGVYRQDFIDVAVLDKAFAEGSQQVSATTVPAAQQEWDSWRFAEVTVDGAGLRATTPEGIELALDYREPALVTGVDSHWVASRNGDLSEALLALANEQRCAPFLTVAAPDSHQWFVVKTGRLISVPNIDLSSAYELIGTQKQTSVLLHERPEGRLSSYPQKGHAGPLDYVQRTAEVQVIDAPARSQDLLPLLADDVSILVLRMGQGEVASRLTQAIWLKLESVIVDCRYALGQPPLIPGKLIWDIKVADQLWASLVDEHLVIVDADSGHSLIFRDVHGGDVSGRGDVFLSMEGYVSCAVSTLVAALVVQKDDSQSIALKQLLSLSRAPSMPALSALA